jgi:hypothetical protein
MPSTTIVSAPAQTATEYRLYLLERRNLLESELNRVLETYNENPHYPDPLFDASFNGAKRFLHTQLEINRLTLKILDCKEAA